MFTSNGAIYLNSRLLGLAAFMRHLDIFPRYCWYKRIGSVTEIYLSVSVNQTHYEFTNKTISSVLSVRMCIITACLIGLPAILPIMFASTFKTNVILFIT